MSKLERLMQELCPEGVEYTRLSGVVKYSQSRIPATNTNDHNYVGVDNLLQNKAGKAISIYTPDAGKLTRYQIGDVLVGNIRPYLKKIWLADCDGGTNGDVLVFRITERKKLNSRYLFYVLSSDTFFSFMMQTSKGAKMPRGDKAAIMKYRIPLPPLPVQREIVRILDTFTELTAELTAELAVRQKQYSFYRNQVFAFPESPWQSLKNRHDVIWTTLEGVSSRISSGGTPLKMHADYYGGNIPWLRTQEVVFGEIHQTEMRITEKALENSSAKWIPKNCVIVAISGATAGRCAINKIPLTTNQHCCNMEIDSKKADYRYVFHWVCSQYEQLKARGQGARNDLNVAIISNFPIPIPPLEEQARIVSILDRFDTLCNDLTSGLPAEIESRRRQYEYYRDKLLTFQEKVT